LDEELLYLAPRCTTPINKDNAAMEDDLTAVFVR
jgi:hypothetical protein